MTLGEFNKKLQLFLDRDERAKDLQLIDYLIPEYDFKVVVSVEFLYRDKGIQISYVTKEKGAYPKTEGF